MKMVIGIFGESCVGKTTVAKVVAQRLNAATRHCGEIVKARAKKLGVTTAQLSADEHELIDQETRNQALNATTQTIVVEGRFLDCVIGDMPNALLIELRCSEEERLRRAKTRTSGQDSALHNRNKTDSGELLHKGKVRIPAHILLSTDGLTPKQVAEEILKRMEEFHHDA